jgi:hypothetical protein
MAGWSATATNRDNTRRPARGAESSSTPMLNKIATEVSNV